jgi:feruloyl esterase
MNIGKYLLLIAIGMITFKATPGLAQDTKCEALKSTAFTANKTDKADGSAGVKIESASLVAASAQVPEHCDVRGTIWPEIGFAIKLPTSWNNRFYMVGGGGYAGQISHGPMVPGLQKGYATASTDTGHSAVKEPLGTFANPGPNNPLADQKLVDYAYRAVHETALLAKKMIKAYYGSEPRYSYWVGCSTGGRQGLMEAQRYPEDFDGLLVGAPVLRISGEQMRGLWNAQAVSTGDGKIASEKIPLLARAVYEKCDAVDGVKDGLIEDPRRCRFDPAVDLPKCADDKDGPDCFTSAQIMGLKKVYGGVRTSAGRLLYPGQPLGAEVAPAGGRTGWSNSIGGEPGVGLAFGETFIRFLTRPPRGADWSYKGFNFDTDPPKLKELSAMIDADNPDLRRLKQRGGKIIHYHGWADALVNPQASVDYYESVVKTMGEKQTSEFYRLYMIPGMFHCAGGVGCDRGDWFAPLVDWVEKGIAPGALISSRIEKNETTRTHPMCVYPETARYIGKGDVNKAGSFTCLKPAR